MTEHVGVIGCGLMGAGIAEAAAREGIAVTVVETSEQVKSATARLRRAFELAAAKGEMSAAEADTALDRIDVTERFERLGDLPLVIEAVPEVREAKAAVFRELDKVLQRDDAVLASNTSSIPIIELAAATTRSEWVVGLHFFNPVRTMRLVEVIPSLRTNEDAIARAKALARRLGKEPVVAPDRAGFIVNALLFPYILSAIRMLEADGPTATEIDKAMVLGCGVPMGPLALADYVGLDTTLSIAESLYDEHREPQYAPPPLLARMVGAGRLGRKSGRGFHEYAAQRGGN